MRAELPGLRLDWLTAGGGSHPSPRALKQRLAQLAGRYRGADVVAMAAQPIPHAYRTCFRQIGLDPDATRIPSEQAAVERLLHGGFPSRGLVDDALLIALLETGVPVWALDAERVDGALGIRLTIAGERLGARKSAPAIPSGRLVIADRSCVQSLLFGPVAPGHGVGARTTRLVLFAVGVAGVSTMHVEEALWSAVEALRRW